MSTATGSIDDMLTDLATTATRLTYRPEMNRLSYEQQDTLLGNLRAFTGQLLLLEKMLFGGLKDEN